MKRCVLVSILFIFLLSFSVFGADLWVSPSAHYGNCTQTSPCDFQRALVIAQTNEEADTIHVMPGTYYGSFIYLPDSTENYALTIQCEGSGCVLDGENAHRILEIITPSNDWNADVTVQGLTFQNGNSENTTYTNGAGLYVKVSSAEVEIIDNTFQNNTATWGGGVYVKSDSGFITLQNNTFQNNTAHMVDAGGGALVRSGSGSISLQNNNFQNNTAGGVYIVVSEKLCFSFQPAPIAFHVTHLRPR